MLALGRRVSDRLDPIAPDAKDERSETVEELNVSA
jgi:hypothetical protein